MGFIENLERKHKYSVQAFIAFAFVYIILFKFHFPLAFIFLLVGLFAIVGLIIVHFPNVRFNNVFYALIMAVSSLVAVVLFFRSFPNLGFYFRLVLLAGFSFGYYAIALIDNVFLVVQDREEQIPLYRVAVTWARIISIMVAIPLFSAIFKLSLNGFWQGFMVSFIALLFSIYQFWQISFDNDLKKPKAGEYLLLNLFIAFIAFVGSVSVAFFPTEAFLRALYVATILMFGLTYVYSHLKNDINRNTILQFLGLITVFFFILLIFTP